MSKTGGLKKIKNTSVIKETEKGFFFRYYVCCGQSFHEIQKDDGPRLFDGSLVLVIFAVTGFFMSIAVRTYLAVKKKEIREKVCLYENRVTYLRGYTLLKYVTHVTCF